MEEGYYFCFSTKLEKFIICWYDGVGVFTTTGSDRELYEKDFDIVCADPIPYPGVTSYPGVIELGNVMHPQESAEVVMQKYLDGNKRARAAMDKNICRLKRTNFFMQHPELIFIFIMLLFIITVLFLKK